MPTRSRTSHSIQYRVPKARIGQGLQNILPGTVTKPTSDLFQVGTKSVVQRGVDAGSSAEQYRRLRERYSLRTPADRAQNGLSLLRAIAKLRGGECLAEGYRNSRAHYRFRCAVGHEWQTSLDSLWQGTWCPGCIGRAPSADHIERLQAIAESRGGVLLSKTYTNNRIPLHWRCAHGHRWAASAGNIKSGKWCPECVGKLPAEKQLRQLKKLAATRGGRCLSNTYSDCDTNLQWRCAAGHLWWATPNNVKRGTWCPACVGQLPGEEWLTRLQAIAEARGGRLLSRRYVSNHTPLRWRCAQGHVWEAMPSNVKSGTWCPECAGRLTPEKQLRELNKIATARGGKCLSAAYVNNSTKLEWLCHKGHAWWAPPSSIKQGYWCRECAWEARRVRKTDKPRIADKKVGNYR